MYNTTTTRKVFVYLCSICVNNFMPQSSTFLLIASFEIRYLVQNRQKTNCFKLFLVS